MAVLTRADVAGVLNLTFGDTMYDQFRRDVTLPHFLDVKPSGNTICTWKTKFDTRTAGGAYNEGADMAAGDYDAYTRVPASLNWSEYRTGAQVSGLAQAVNAANGGGLYGGDLFMAEVADAIDELAVIYSAALYSGNPGASPVELAGAALAVDGSAGTFATIATATYPDWVSTEASIAGALLSKKTIRENLLSPIKFASGHRPLFVTVPDDLWDQIKSLADEGATDIKEIQYNGEMLDIMAITGTTGVSIDGVPFINDRHATSGTMYAFNPRFMHIEQVPSAINSPARLVQNVKALTGVDVTIQEVEARLRRMAGRLQPTVEILAQTGDAYKAQVKVYSQVAWTRRDAHGKLTVT